MKQHLLDFGRTFLAFVLALLLMGAATKIRLNQLDWPATGLVKVTDATNETVTTVTAPSGAIVGDTDTQTLTNKTLTSPTIAKIANLTGNGAVYTTSGNGTLNVSSSFTFPSLAQAALSYDVNSTTELESINSTDGSQAEAVISANSTGSAVSLRAMSLSYTPFGFIVPPATWLESTAPLYITAAPIYFGSSVGSEGARYFFGQTVASAASATLDEVRFPAQTSTVTGTTNITTAKGFNKVSIYQPTYTDSSAVTVTAGATVYIEGAPAAAGSLTLTNPYALWVDSGNVRFDGHGAVGLGLLVGTTSGTPASGVVDAVTGYRVNGAASARTILVGNGTNFVPSTETYAAPGATGGMLQSDGTNWVRTLRVAAQSGTASSTTSSTSEANLVVVTIPAAALNANGCIRVTSLWKFVGTAGAKTPVIRFSSTSGATSGGGVYYNTSTSATALGLKVVTDIYNANSASSQVGGIASAAAGSGQSTAAPTTSSINTANASYVNFNGAVANAADSLQLVGYTVEIINP